MAALMKYKWIIILVGAMTAEAVVLMMLLPAPASKTAAKEGTSEATDEASTEWLEIDLGEFRVTNAIGPSELLVSCKVVVAVNKPVGAEAPAKDAKDSSPPNFVRKRFRIREAIQTVIRKANLESLREPTLATIKRQVHAAVNEVLGSDKPSVESIIIADFKVTESI